MHNKLVHLVAFGLLVVGGLNWLLVGAFDLNLVTMLLGEGTAANVVYILVGLAAVLEMFTHKGHCKDCSN
ncbi:hypothetical protein A2592_01820 [Candidatus Kaiserbacteria bacterium RIFOXYD1_FULL_42_15]|uniref:DUF378 domain-containing protein n=1 Tax=Candidatus Kaiserbacteria bacterium RIFOXYD1_FULL_42_15 TaxID=1798532 RepID=A0A1F6FQQ1_9BACT|nr:MAG: hypothetical protein A2592_01820 [Candidatus Kaiserbacteria bacterium RIFOXYD1_FULL_42_15]